MCIEDFLKSLELPKKYYDSNFDISEKYAEEANIFIEGLKKIDVVEFSSAEKQEKIVDKFNLLIQNAEKSVHKVLEIFKYYEGADLKSA